MDQNKKSQFEKDVEQAEYFVWLTSLVLFSLFTGFVSTALILW